MMFQRQKLVSRIISQLLLVVAAIMLLLPLGLMLARSLQGQGIGNYLAVLEGTPFFSFMGNSAIIAGVTVVAVLVLTVLSAFAVAMLRPPGSFGISLLLMAGLSLPGVAIIVPLFSLFQILGLFDTYWAVIVPLTAISIPFGVLLTTNYMRGLPGEIFEAAKIDGASSFRFLISVLVPLCRPILAVIVVFTFLAAWNEYLLPLVFIQSTDMQVVTQVPGYFQSEHLVDTSKVIAANILISIPVIVAYILLQKQFREGLSGGAIK